MGEEKKRDKQYNRLPSGKRSSGGLFDAYMTKINAMKAANDSGDVTSEEVLAAANQVIAEATKRRARERARLDEELKQLELAEAIRETDEEVAELARQRSEAGSAGRTGVSRGDSSAETDAMQEGSAVGKKNTRRSRTDQDTGSAAAGQKKTETESVKAKTTEKKSSEKTSLKKESSEKTSLKKEGQEKRSSEKADAEKADTAKTASWKTDAEKAGFGKTDAEKAGFGKTDAEKAGSGKTDAGKIGSGKTAAEKTASEKLSGEDSTDKASEKGSKKNGRKGSKKSRALAKKRRRRRKIIRTALILLLCVFVAAGSIGTVWLIRKFTPSNERMSAEEYFGSMGQNENAIVLQDENITKRALVYDNSLYVPYSLVGDQLNSRFYWDESSSKLLFTTAYQTFEIPINSTSYSVIDGARSSDPISQSIYDHVVLLRDDGALTEASAEPAAEDAAALEGQGDAALVEEQDAEKTGAEEGVSSDDESYEEEDAQAEQQEEKDRLYLNIDFLAQYTNIAYNWEKDTRHVLIRCRWGEMLKATASKESPVRFQGGIKSPILTDLEKGEEVYVLEEGDKWNKVLTDDGYIGWVQRKRMSDPVLKDVQNEGFQEVEYPDLCSDKKITLVWHYVDSEKGNSNYESKAEYMSGVDVISPTWFSLKDNDGGIKSIGKKSYVRKAHEDGLQVWGLVSDFSSDMDTSVLLASTQARRSCVANLIDEAVRLGIDGINLDFEYMDAADGKAYSQFVRELSIACRRGGLVLSVDLTPPYDFNSYIDRKEVAAVADYLINMGYDEHYVGSEAGTTASKAYEERAMKELLAMGISSRKILSGVPFYTRIWYSSWNSDGSQNLSSEELSMSVVNTTLETWGVTPVWDPAAEQYYADWTVDDGVRCQIWVENEESMARKILLVPKYNLGGTAAWVLGYEIPEIWTVISENRDLTAEEAAAKEQEYARKDAQYSTEAGTEAQEES